uniref:Uncharacterized protein n=1 Tax=Kalanchoe fedtschenkoi TaxID=63787 RepID=A0A7N0TEG4_KALFE
MLDNIKLLHMSNLLKLTFISILIIASSHPSSAAGRGFAGRTFQGPHAHHVTEEEIHERLLSRVNTKDDYGQYDPSPTFVRPPFKLIPN